MAGLFGLLTAILWLSGCGIIYVLVQWVTRRIKEYNQGCYRAPRYPHKDWIWGLDLYLEEKRAGSQALWLPRNLSLFNKIGKTYEVIWLGRRMIQTIDQTNIQSAFANDAKSWGLEPLRKGIAVPFFDRGLNTTDGEFHRRSRALVRPTFARTEVADLTFLKQHTDFLLDRLPQDGTTVDLQPLISSLMLDALTNFLFGESMDSLRHSEGEAKRFIDAFDYCLFALGQRVRLGRLRFLHYDSKWQKSIKVVHGQVDRYIDNAFASIDGGKAPGQDSGRYILLYEMARVVKDRDELRSQILAIFMPGRDSTGYALSNVLHVLARQPEVYNKLRAEVIAQSSNEFTFEQLKSLKYLQGVLHEGHRLYPTTAQTPRVCLEDTTLPTGGGPDGKRPIFVQKGDHLMVSIYALHRDIDIWGEDASEFRPERWQSARPIWTFIPFLGGPRTCPAQQMVITQEAYVLARLVKAVQHIENRDPHPWIEERRIGFQSKYGVKVGLWS